MTPDDLRSRSIQTKLDGPRCPQNPLARLMTSAQGGLSLSQTEPDAERRRKIKLKANRAKELRAAFGLA